MRFGKLGWMGLVLVLGAQAQAAQTSMQPGLWSMDIQGSTQVGPDSTVPVQRQMKICVKPGQPPESIVVPADDKTCTRSQATLPDGKTQWTFHCTVQQAKVTQVGSFESSASTFDSHWTISTDLPSGAKTSTQVQVTGKRLGADCGDVK